ncbi:MAG: hypothetical protein CME63_00545 [Halobacteriovoraceae bacterium]|nr:hypothetical protein [Halobacteriovoraceae bacterium]MBC96213.1 hypothetical protein [Halobacteriovoraceae bacterium]
MECIAVTYCLSKTTSVDQDNYIFHFKGFFMGNKIEAIKVVSKNEEFFIGEEYILHLRIREVDKKTLVAKCIRKKVLGEIRSDFL